MLLVCQCTQIFCMTWNCGHKIMWRNNVLNICMYVFCAVELEDNPLWVPGSSQYTQSLFFPLQSKWCTASNLSIWLNSLQINIWAAQALCISLNINLASLAFPNFVWFMHIVQQYTCSSIFNYTSRAIFFNNFHILNFRANLFLVDYMFK